MAKVKAVEKRISKVEGFNVRIRHKITHRDVRGDYQWLPQYKGFQRAAKDEMTVGYWKFTRFHVRYPGYHVDVLDGSGRAVRGNMKLGTVRHSYF